MMILMKTTPAAKKLEAMYAAAGLPCELDPGLVGIVVYAATPAIASAVANGLARGPLALGVAVEVEAPCFEVDENTETAWVATVRFDWNKMPSSASACTVSLGNSVSQ